MVIDLSIKSEANLVTFLVEQWILKKKIYVAYKKCEFCGSYLVVLTMN
jgi:hypothetical protein